MYVSRSSKEIYKTITTIIIVNKYELTKKKQQQKHEGGVAADE